MGKYPDCVFDYSDTFANTLDLYEAIKKIRRKDDQIYLLKESLTDLKAKLM